MFKDDQGGRKMRDTLRTPTRFGKDPYEGCREGLTQERTQGHFVRNSQGALGGPTSTGMLRVTQEGVLWRSPGVAED